MKRIVIIGAGYAGVLTAKKLARRLRKTKALDAVEVVLIDQNPYHTMLTELHEVAAGRVDPESIRMDLGKIFARRSVTVIQDRIEQVKAQEKQLIGQKGSYSYDYLVMATGSKPTFFGTPGAETYAATLWSYEDALALRHRIQKAFSDAVQTTDEALRQSLLSFCIVGSGFTGVEMAGELAEYRDVLCHSYELDPKTVRIRVVDFLPRPIATLKEKLSQKVLKRFEKMNIEFSGQTGVQSVEKDAVLLKSGEAVERWATQTVIWAAGIESSDLAANPDSNWTVAPRSRGRIQTNAYLQTETDESIYVVGDNLFYIRSGDTRPVPQMVENAEASAETCAHNLLASLGLTSKGLKAYEPTFHGVMCSVGGRYCVAQVGFNEKKTYSLASFFAMLSKHFINILYFIQVLGWNKVFSYVKHEFLTIRNRRSFLGGHFSNVTPSFLLVFIRLWLGAVWVFEGVKKIVEGWMTTPKLAAFFGGADRFFEGILNPADAASAATDVAETATAATGEAVAAAGEALINLNLGLVDFQMISAKPLAEASLNDLAMRFHADWIQTILAYTATANTTTERIFQAMVAVLEILIGLGLMGGAFTTLSAAVSLALQFAFLTTTGLFLGTVWMIPAGIACLFGAGQTFGIDYYLMPALKKGWKRTRLARKSYLYHD